jgi:hypothetical protein
MRKPKWVAEVRAAQAEYERAGLNLARVDGRGWRVHGLHPTEPRTFTLWGGLAELVADRDGIVARFREMTAE